jgi:hypothetical protein
VRLKFLQLLKKPVTLTDIASMKPFFQGLVFGLVVMYGYLNHGVDLLGPFRGWFDGASKDIKNDRKQKEADKALHGFLFRHDTKNLA